MLLYNECKNLVTYLYYFPLFLNNRLFWIRIAKKAELGHTIASRIHDSISNVIQVIIGFTNKLSSWSYLLLHVTRHNTFLTRKDCESWRIHSLQTAFTSKLRRYSKKFLPYVCLRDKRLNPKPLSLLQNCTQFIFEFWTWWAHSNILYASYFRVLPFIINSWYCAISDWSCALTLTRWATYGYAYRNASCKCNFASEL